MKPGNGIAWRVAGIALVGIAAVAPAQTVVRVSRSGGDYTDVQAAVNYCAFTNNDANGCIIEVDPDYTYSSARRLSFPEQKTEQQKWIILRSSRISELPPGVRVRPSDAPLMPKFTVTGTEPVMRFEARARYYRLEGLEVFADNRRTQNLIEIGSNLFSEPGDIPEQIVLDRLYIHGPELKNTALKSAIKADGRGVEIRNCFIHQIQNANGQETQGIATTNSPGPLLVRNNRIEALSIGSLMGGFPPAVKGQVLTDSKWLGNHYTKDIRWKSLFIDRDPTGPCLPGEWRRNQKAQPNTLWECQQPFANVEPAWVLRGAITSAEENPPAAACTTGDHWINKRTTSFWDCIDSAWVQTDNPHTWTGGAAEFGGMEKNLWECKTCSIVLVEGNVLERAWGPGAQSQWGYAFLLNNVDSSNGQARWVKIEHVFIRNNWTRDHGPVMAFGYSGRNEFYDDPLRTHHVVFENNLAENANGPLWQVAGGVRTLWFSGAHMLQVRNNTLIGTQTVENGAFANGTTVELDRPLMGLVWLNNIFPAGEAGLRSGAALPGTRTLLRFAPDGDYRYNVMVKDTPSPWVPRGYSVREEGVDPCCTAWGLPPAPGRFVSWRDSWEQVGFVNFNSGVTDPVLSLMAKKLCQGEGNPDPQCKAASPYAVSPVDGRPPGADIDLVAWATEGAVAGVDNPWFDFQIRSAHPSTGIVYTAYSTASCRVLVSEDRNFATTLYDQEDGGGDRDRTLTVGGADSDAQVKLPEAKLYYVKVLCEGGRYRETELRNF